MSHPSLVAIERAGRAAACRAGRLPVSARGSQGAGPRAEAHRVHPGGGGRARRSARVAPSPIVLGGRSMGGRMCSMAVAEALPAAGLVLISYPLHPPGKPDNLRIEHLPSLALPCLFISGTAGRVRYARGARARDSRDPRRGDPRLDRGRTARARARRREDRHRCRGLAVEPVERLLARRRGGTRRCRGASTPR